MKTLKELTEELLSNYDDKVIALAQHLDIDLEPDFDENDSYYIANREDYDTDEEYNEAQTELDEEKEQAMNDAVQEIADELDSIREVSYSDNTFEYGSEEYEVLTDSEADDRMEEELDNYIEECIYPEIKDEHLRNYFDEEAWKSDARMDGRGHIISRYDGCEYEEKVNDTWYYIFRQN